MGTHILSAAWLSVLESRTPEKGSSLTRCNISKSNPKQGKITTWLCNKDDVSIACSDSLWLSSEFNQGTEPSFPIASLCYKCLSILFALFPSRCYYYLFLQYFGDEQVFCCFGFLFFFHSFTRETLQNLSIEWLIRGHLLSQFVRLGWKFRFPNTDVI